MGAFEVNRNKFRKVTGIAEHQAESESDRRVRAIIKVTKENYVPDAVELNYRFSPTMFSAELSIGQLQELEKDEYVTSVAVSERLSIIE